MIVVRVELHSAITGKTKEIAAMTIANDGSSPTTAIGHYNAATTRKGPAPKTRAELAQAVSLFKGKVRTSRVEDYRRNARPVWDLVALALKGMGYGA